MIASIQGIGWIVGNTCGAVRPGDGAIRRQRTGRLRWRDVSDRPFSRFGRMGLLAKYAVAAAELAGLPPVEEAGKVPTAIVLATCSGVLTTDVAFQQTLRRTEGPSPLIFPYSLPTAALGEVSLRYGLTGPATAAVVAEALASNALLRGLECLIADEADHCLCLACEANDRDVQEQFGLQAQPPVGMAVLLGRRETGAAGEIAQAAVAPAEAPVAAAPSAVTSVRQIVDHLCEVTADRELILAGDGASVRLVRGPVATAR